MVWNLCRANHFKYEELHTVAMRSSTWILIPDGLCLHAFEPCAFAHALEPEFDGLSFVSQLVLLRAAWAAPPISRSVGTR